MKTSVFHTEVNNVHKSSLTMPKKIKKITWETNYTNKKTQLSTAALHILSTKMTNPLRIPL